MNAAPVPTCRTCENKLWFTFYLLVLVDFGVNQPPTPIYDLAFDTSVGLPFRVAPIPGKPNDE